MIRFNGCPFLVFTGTGSTGMMSSRLWHSHSGQTKLIQVRREKILLSRCGNSLNVFIFSYSFENRGRESREKRELLVMGIDPGTYRMGVGLVESDGDSYFLRLSDALSPPRGGELHERLGWLHGRLDDLMGEANPDVVAVESPFVGRNIKAAISIGQAQAVAMVAAASRGIPVRTYAPRDVKKAVTDNGGSSKEQVQDMVQFLLNLPCPMEPTDRADAAAVAICHINSVQTHDIEMWE